MRVRGVCRCACWVRACAPCRHSLSCRAVASVFSLPTSWAPSGLRAACAPPAGSETPRSPRVTAKKGSTPGARRLSVPQRVSVVVRRVLGRARTWSAVHVHKHASGAPRIARARRLTRPHSAATQLCASPASSLAPASRSPAAGQGAVPAGCGRARGGPLLLGRTMRPLSGRARGRGAGPGATSEPWRCGPRGDG